MNFSKLLFVFMFLVTIELSSEARAYCPGKKMMCGTTCTSNQKTNECGCTGPCDGKGDVKSDGNGDGTGFFEFTGTHSPKIVFS